ncbi:MAG: metal-dependent hydrolase [Myxococcales bacterium]|nr:metal-dependent hydrolase [Myxococcales bacterium]
MDAITQGVLGAAAAQACLSDRLGKRTWLLGALGGMAPDLDVFIRSSVDPLVALEYHRNFTHSLAFIPVGGLLVALPWILRRRPREERVAIVLATTVGYATHGLLDAFTSYGTMLLWPFSRARVAWSWISIIDLGYTVPLIVGVILAARRVSARPARIALVISSLYMAFCGLQRARVMAAQDVLIALRGETAVKADAYPSLANNVTWRSVYEADGEIHVDKIRAPWLGATRVIAGGEAPRVRLDELPAIAADPETRRAFELFAWFSDGWLARDPDDPTLIGDLRYALAPGDARGMWGLRLRPGGDPAVTWESGRGRERLDLGRAWTILFEDGGEPLLIGNARP